jgi:hypothetical protein
MQALVSATTSRKLSHLIGSKAVFGGCMEGEGRRDAPKNMRLSELSMDS